MINELTLLLVISTTLSSELIKWLVQIVAKGRKPRLFFLIFYGFDDWNDFILDHIVNEYLSWRGIYLHEIWFDHYPLIRAIEYNTAMIIGTDIIQSCIITIIVKKSEHMWRFGRGQRRQWWQVATRRTSYKLIDGIVDFEWNWRGKN